MKLLSYIFGIFISIIIVVYAALFTSIGNSFTKPIIEQNIQKQLALPSKVDKFHLSMDDFEILLELTNNNTLHIVGEYSLFTQNFHLQYNLRLNELQTLTPLTQTPLQGRFATHGEIQGSMKYFIIKGESDIAKSTTSYSLDIKEFSPVSIIAQVQNLDLQSLLFILKQKQYASAQLNLALHFKDITPHHLDGTLNLSTQDGKVNSHVMKEDFNVTIPATTFRMNLKAKLHNDDITYKYFLNSNLAKLSSSGEVTPQPLKLNAKYGVDIKELALLKPITGVDVRGELRLSGVIKGTQPSMKLYGKTNIADSRTSFEAQLKDFAPQTFQAKIKSLKIEQLLYMLHQPHYSDGIFSATINITDTNLKSMQGDVVTTITQGVLDHRYLTKAYKFKSMMPITHFNTKTVTKIQNGVADTKIDFNSNLANLDIAHAKYTLTKNLLESDYNFKVPNLSKLFFITQRDLRGAFLANGMIKKGKDLDLTMHSNIVGGEIDVTLHNDDLKATLVSLQTLKILDMLVYPKIFQATLDGELLYNLLSQKGTFQGKLSQGIFTHNQMLDLTKKYARVDLYKEHFTGDVDAKINKEKVLTSLFLRSNKSSIKTKDAKLNTKTQQIDAKVDINANKNELSITLKGDINSPSYKVDASKIIKKEANKAIQKGVDRLLKRLF